MMPKLLFLGCNHSQVPYLLAAKKLGFFVVGTDLNPDAPGAKLADRFYKASYIDVNELRRVAEMESWSDRDQIFTAAAHFAYEGASKLATTLGVSFFSPETIDTCLDKTKFYSLLDDHDVPVPPTFLYEESNHRALDPGKVYYLKSDYGKSPKYCYRVINGQVPPLPEKKNLFYRNHFLIQEEVRGTHFRVNLYAGQASIFMKFSDTSAVAVKVLGPGNTEVMRRLREVISSLGLDAALVKFDLIVNEENWYVIDIGLDPPMRLRLFCEYIGIDFPRAYIRYYLLGDAHAMPVWASVCKSVIIQGSPQHGFRFIPMEEEL